MAGNRHSPTDSLDTTSPLTELFAELSSDCPRSPFLHRSSSSTSSAGPQPIPRKSSTDADPSSAGWGSALWGVTHSFPFPPPRQVNDGNDEHDFPCNQSTTSSIESVVGSPSIFFQMQLRRHMRRMRQKQKVFLKQQTRQLKREQQQITHTASQPQKEVVSPQIKPTIDLAICDSSLGPPLEDGWLDSPINEEKKASFRRYPSQDLHSTVTNPKSPLLCIFEDALSKGHGSLQLAGEGVGGTYFVCTKQGTKVAVFKPMDEEPGAADNPRGHTEACSGTSTIGGILPGTSWRREIAAFVLDHEGFARVPETAYAHLPASWGIFPKDKQGSLQDMVTWKATQAKLKNEGFNLNECGQIFPSADLTPGRFSVEDVHRIGILDLRLCNCDRHGGNILALVPEDDASRRSIPIPLLTEAQRQRLVPIDHGFVLPTNLMDLDFEWEWWPQAAVPFSPASLAYISNLDPEADAKTLINLGIEPEAVMLMKAASFVVKIGATAGLTLRQLATLLRRLTLDSPGEVEALLTQSSGAQSDLLRNELVDWDKFCNGIYELVKHVRS